MFIRFVVWNWGGESFRKLWQTQPRLNLKRRNNDLSKIDQLHWTCANVLRFTPIFKSERKFKAYVKLYRILDFEKEVFFSLEFNPGIHELHLGPVSTVWWATVIKYIAKLGILFRMSYSKEYLFNLGKQGLVSAIYNFMKEHSLYAVLPHIKLSLDYARNMSRSILIMYINYMSGLVIRRCTYLSSIRLWDMEFWFNFILSVRFKERKIVS